MTRETTILGQTYAGRPMFGSLALDIMCMEQLRGREAAQALLNAHNQIRRAFGDEPVDLAADMTDVPMDGLIVVPVAKAPAKRRAAA